MIEDEQINTETPTASQPTATSDDAQSTKAKRATANKRVKEKTYQIKLHNNSEIPPNGLYVGVNGRWMMLKPNTEMEVPESALEVLDNAVREEAEKDEHNRVVGRREVPRFPYSVVRKR